MNFKYLTSLKSIKSGIKFIGLFSLICIFLTNCSVPNEMKPKKVKGKTNNIMIYQFFKIEFKSQFKSLELISLFEFFKLNFEYILQISKFNFKN